MIREEAILLYWCHNETFVQQYIIQILIFPHHDYFSPFILC